MTPERKGEEMNRKSRKKLEYVIEINKKDWCYIILPDGEIIHAHNLVNTHNVVIKGGERNP